MNGGPLAVFTGGGLGVVSKVQRCKKSGGARLTDTNRRGVNRWEGLLVGRSEGPDAFAK